jgi:excisionase family DNA binding protein
LTESPDDQLTVREVESRYRVSRDTLKRRIRSGALPHTRVLHRLYFKRSDVERAIGVERHETTAGGR